MPQTTQSSPQTGAETTFTEMEQQREDYAALTDLETNIYIACNFLSTSSQQPSCWRTIAAATNSNDPSFTTDVAVSIVPLVKSWQCYGMQCMPTIESLAPLDLGRYPG